MESTTPASYFDDRRGLQGKVQQCLRHNLTLYVASTTGLYAIMSPGVASDGVRAVASRIPEISGEFWDLLALDSMLLVAGRSGIYALNRSPSDEQPATLISHYDAYAFLPSRADSNRVFLALDDGLAFIYRDMAHEGDALGGDSGRVAGVPKEFAG